LDSTSEVSRWTSPLTSRFFEYPSTLNLVPELIWTAVLTELAHTIDGSRDEVSRAVERFAEQQVSGLNPTN
jgi:hypothetical protein